jgi:hypothetical protein
MDQGAEPAGCIRPVSPVLESLDMTPRYLPAPLAATALLALGAGAYAQQASPQERDQRHAAGAEGSPTMLTPAARGSAAAMGSGRSGMMAMMHGTTQAMMSGGVMPMMMGFADHVEGSLAFIKAELKITEAQMPQWSAFADAVRGSSNAMKEAHEKMSVKPAEMQLPQKLDFHEAMLIQHLAALRKMKAAVEPLYAALSEEQRKTADELLAPMGMM